MLSFCQCEGEQAVGGPSGTRLCDQMLLLMPHILSGAGVVRSHFHPQSFRGHNCFLRFLFILGTELGEQLNDGRYMWTTSYYGRARIPLKN